MFDGKVSDLRQWYESHSLEERGELRAFLEKVNADAREADKWGIELRACSRLDVYDDAGELTNWVDAEFDPWTILSAIAAWDQGEEFAPSSVRP
jgi:hypothetical protein